jgi:hypothetical protein
MTVEIGDKVEIDCEMYCGVAYVLSWTLTGAYVSLRERGNKPFFVLTRAIVEIRS